MGDVMTQEDDKSSGGSDRSERAKIFRYLLGRLAVYLVTLWASLSLAFLAFRLMPGEPMRVIIAQLSRVQGNLGPEEEKRVIAYYNHLFGLDRPVTMQYLIYFRNVVFRGFDLGPSFVAYPVSTRELIFRHIPWTLGIFTTSVIIAWGVGTGLGVVVASIWGSNFFLLL